MGTAAPPAAVKLIAGLLAVSDARLDEAVVRLHEYFGPTDATSATHDWNFSEYYRREMGPGLRRRFISFARLIAPGKLAGFKLATNLLESAWRVETRRQVNLDPGYLTALKLVLASTKDAAHRVYLSGGIYAEVTLHFRDGSFQPHSCTYPDYAMPETVAFFNAVRAGYLAQIRDRLV
jgi:hypothetical protein